MNEGINNIEQAEAVRPSATESPLHAGRHVLITPVLGGAPQTATAAPRLGLFQIPLR